MVHKTHGIGAGLLIAFLLFAGSAAASPLAIAQGEGGGEAQGEAHGNYYADASGALDKADETNERAQSQASAAAHSADHAYAEKKGEAWTQINQTERPETPDCRCQEIADELDHVGNAEFEHTDAIEKAAELDTEYVDAGADVGASGTVKAFFKDAFSGIGDAFQSLGGLLGMDTDADEQAKDLARDTLDADEEARGQLLSTIDEDRDLPRVDPRLDGDLAAQHTSSATSSALANADGNLP